MLRPRSLEDLQFLQTNPDACRGLAIFLIREEIPGLPTYGFHQMLPDGTLVQKKSMTMEAVLTRGIVHAEATLVTGQKGKKAMPCRPGYYKERNERRKQQQSK
jgi:hypothetical protein